MSIFTNPRFPFCKYFVFATCIRFFVKFRPFVTLFVTFGHVIIQVVHEAYLTERCFIFQGQGCPTILRPFHANLHKMFSTYLKCRMWAVQCKYIVKKKDTEVKNIPIVIVKGARHYLSWKTSAWRHHFSRLPSDHNKQHLLLLSHYGQLQNSK